MTLRFGGPGGVGLLATGRELTDAMKEMNAGAGETVVRLLEKENEATILTFGRKDDLVAFLKHRNTAMACDCGATIATRIHPRNWGSFPGVLGRYVRETGALALPDAVRKMTALPASIIGMADRGYLAPGMRADVIVFDPAVIGDRATYAEPTLVSQGVRHVFVNGRAALRDGKPTGVQGGGIVLRMRHIPAVRRRTRAGAEPRRAPARCPTGRAATPFASSPRKRRANDSRPARYSCATAKRARHGPPDRLGTIQTTDGWTSMTAMLRDASGRARPATLTIDRGAASGAPGGGTVLVLSLDGAGELTGAANGQARTTTR